MINQTRNTSKHERRSIRLKEFDYSQPGAYFLTLCAHNRQCLFGKFEKGAMRESPAGEIVRSEWLRSQGIRSEIELDAFVLMPNHLHGIVLIHDADMSSLRAHGRAPLHRKAKTLGSFVSGFKSAATKRINALLLTPGKSVWQRNYYEHIVRNENELASVRKYISENPLGWEIDRENPGADTIADKEPWET